MNKNKYISKRFALGFSAAFIANAILLFSALPAKAQSVVISELMYHPLDGTNPVDGDLYEFVEIYNPNPATFDLSDAEFTKGISYTFADPTLLPSEGFLVLKRDNAAFYARYPSVTNTAPGEYSGKLSNGGEKITLKDRTGTTLFSVDYSDGDGWPEWPDGLGASLLLANESGDPDDPLNWGASDTFHGTPGEAGSVSSNDIVINEVLSHTDLPQEDSIELHNRTDGAIDISGWYLSDDSLIRNKYQITNTTIAAGAYTVIYESQFNSGSYGNTAFALSELGDSVYLTAADESSNLTRFVDCVDFAASENGVSFGKYPNGTGEIVILAELSLGSSNGPPQIGPIVISEIMYHPPNDNFDEEYIELLNISSNTVELYDILHATNTWKLTSAIDYLFPTNISVAPDEFILITGATNLNTFRSTYGLAGDIQVFGPWSGKLDNAGETINLYKPGAPETNEIPYILVDSLAYTDNAPWPTAPDGNGPSLERVSVTNYGNDSANWFAGPPGGSPGNDPVGGFVNPQFIPASPVPEAAFTVTVSVVAETLPTQVLFRASINGTENNHAMKDDGLSPDITAGDQIYTTTLAGQSDGTWLYYRFMASGSNNAAFSLPTDAIVYPPSPTLTIRMSWGEMLTTVQPTEIWQTYQTAGDATHTNQLYIYLDDEGEVLVDDISIIDDATSTEHVQNGDFSLPLSGTWEAYGTQSESFRDQEFSGNTNSVLHVVASGPGSNWNNSVNTKLDPAVTVLEPCTLSLRTRLISESQTNWLWLVIGTAQPDVVINEIMYHPNKTNETAFEYVELYNPGTGAVDICGWDLDGVRLVMPAGTVIGADLYLVCAAQTNAIESGYGITNVLSAWRGNLNNGGETISLINQYGREIDKADYIDSHPWPPAADGYGPSIERIDSTHPGTNSANWLSSTAETNWQHVSWTGEISEANSGISFFLDYDRLCWIDDVSITPNGSSTELLPNGNFESGTNGWAFQGNHAQSRIEAGMGRGAGAGLALTCNITRWVTRGWQVPLIIEYGDSITNNVKSASLSTTNGHEYVVSWWVRRSGLGSNVYQVTDANTNAVSFAQTGTPGIPNSTPTDALPVGIESVSQSYNICPVGTQNIVRATLLDSDGITDVILKYRSFAETEYEFTDGHYTNLTMNDDGVAPDIAVGDGIYSVAMPAFSTNRIFVRYHVSLETTNSWTARYPRCDSMSPDLAYWVDNVPAQQTQIPNWHILSDGGPIFYPYIRKACVVSPNGQLFVDAVVRQRGNPVNSPLRNGVAFRTYRDNRLDTWFANNQPGINFRHRGNDSSYWYFRVVNEYLAYYLQKTIGLPSPRVRHTCLWVDGEPTITMSLEDTEEPFLSDHDISTDDFLSRAGWRGRVTIGGDEALDNFKSSQQAMIDAAPAEKEEVIRTNMCMEIVGYAQALLSVCASFDQQMAWNMFQHRNATDGRWAMFPWDTDKTFFPAYTNLHPYYQSPLHLSVYGGYTNMPSRVLYYPETGENAIYTLPYRHQHQMALWRYCHTIFSTNFVFAELDRIQTNLSPAYAQIGVSDYDLNYKIDEVKDFILSRHDFLRNGSWSDRDPSIWSSTNVYDPSTIVINELMPNPVSGGEYLELYNTGNQTVDVSWWNLRIGSESYNLPHSTMIGPTSFLVVADAQLLLTNVYSELSHPSTMLRRYTASPLWDWPVVWTSATEYATRVVQVSDITLPNNGAVIELADLQSNLVDTVAYTNTSPWPTSYKYSLELIMPSSDNTLSTNWRLCTIVGTPGTRNSALMDTDQDTMADDWEQDIIEASGGTYTSVIQILTTDDFDGDGVSNIDEWTLGTNPISNDIQRVEIAIERTNDNSLISFETIEPTPEDYEKYDSRSYTLESTESLYPVDAWLSITNYTDLHGYGQTVSYTNETDLPKIFYRYQIHLIPLRE